MANRVVKMKFKDEKQADKAIELMMQMCKGVDDITSSYESINLLDKINENAIQDCIEALTSNKVDSITAKIAIVRFLKEIGHGGIASLYQNVG